MKKSSKQICKNIFKRLKKLFITDQYDSNAYWKNRAEKKDQSPVLWKNELYNELYRNRQIEIMKPYLDELRTENFVLDVGCGIGKVAKMIIQYRDDIHVEGVDFTEMIRIARKQNPHNKIHYIENSAEEYIDTSKRYNLILSSACYSAIKDIDKMKTAIHNATQMLAKGGTILMIDPFHRWSYLARAKFSTNQVIQLMNSWGFKCTNKSGVLFWPYRELLANSKLNKEQMEKKFIQGEKLLKLLGVNLWSDYKIISFKKE